LPDGGLGATFTVFLAPHHGEAAVEGYTYGGPEVATSPVTVDELAQLEASVTWTEDDASALREAAKVLDGQIEDILDVWYGFVGSHPFLLAAFSDPDGQPVEEYLARVRARFGQWIRDACDRPHDQAWLDYQHEIGLHTRAKKNMTDGVQAADQVPMRYLLALIYPIAATVRPFLAKKGHSEEQVEAMWQAWFKAVTLHVTLWSRAYCAAGDW
jgi:hypothetical protein